ncbi:Ceramide Synthase 5 [Manis pentadactyla]|nr:Ceramide Synthase 5 [Manis pentadactyla]
MAWGWVSGPQIWLPEQFSSSDLACDAFKPLKQIAKKFVQEDICLLVKLATRVQEPGGPRAAPLGEDIFGDRVRSSGE